MESDKIKELEDQLKQKDTQLKIKDNQLKQTHNELQALKDKTYEEIIKNGHVYIIKCDGGIKVGKTKLPVNKRIKGLQTGNVDDIEILFDCETNNADLLERCVHDILYKYRCKSNREFFDCDVEYIKMIIEYTNTTFNTMKSTYQNITKEELYHKYTSKIEEIKEKYNIEEYEEEIDEDYEIKQLLRENYNYSNNVKDFVLYKHVKAMLKNNSIIMDKDSLINSIKTIFPDSEYNNVKCIYYKNYRNVFTNLKQIYF